MKCPNHQALQDVVVRMDEVALKGLDIDEGIKVVQRKGFEGLLRACLIINDELAITCFKRKG